MDAVSQPFTDGVHTNFNHSDESENEEHQPIVEHALMSRPYIDVSQALGEKMLQGWTLLADQCPR